MEESNERTHLLRSDSSRNESTEDNGIPKDRYNLVYIILYLLGTGSLLPWNFFSNAKEYFSYQLRNTSVPLENWKDENSTTNLQNMFESYLSIAAMLPNVLFLFLNTVLTKHIALNTRMVCASITMIVMFIITVGLVYCDTEPWQAGFFAFTLVTIVIMNACQAIFASAIIGISTQFSELYTQAIMGGMGMGGTIAAVANVLAVTIATNPLNMGFGYFLTALLVLILALMGYLLLPFLKFARYYRALHNNSSGVSVSDSGSTEKREESDEEEANIRIEFVDPRPITLPPQQHLSLYQVFLRIRTYALLVFFLFTVTLSCYPAVSSTIKSMNKGTWGDTYFVPVVSFLLFNASDLIGRTLPGWFIWPKEDSPLLVIFCVSRVAFIPLFLLCNKPSGYVPTYFTSDAIPILLMILFGASNGYLGTLCMMYGPRRVPAQDTETAGSMMSFFLALGLGAGSVVSFPFVKLQTYTG